MYALEINNLKFKYSSSDNKDIINDLSLTVNKGEYVTIVGHNGSGKSTLAKLIIGLLKANEGEIKVMGEVLTEENVRSIRYKIGIVFQNPDNQFIGSTVRDDIAFGLENHCIDHDDMDDIINEFSKKVNMEEFLDKEPSSLSGGQKQRVAIAGVLAMKPDIIILDEATAMLDPRGKREIIELVHKLKKEQNDLTILSITHDVEEAYISDRVIVINEGKIMFNDKPREVFSYEKELINMGLDIPFEMKIKSLLNKEKIDVKDLSTLEQVKDYLCR